MGTIITRYGSAYDAPYGISEEKYIEIIEEFVGLAKIKGLTVRQAQKLFTDCANAVLGTKL